jgi:hypothetical protein
MGASPMHIAAASRSADHEEPLRGELHGRGAHATLKAVAATC